MSIMTETIISINLFFDNLCKRRLKMVLYVMKWDAHPDKWETYLKWAQSAIKRTISVSGVVEMRAYRPATGGSQIVATYEFADMESWAAWNENEDIKRVMEELHTLALNIHTELWGPSYVVPKPIRP
jgi:quinol monooxygenase YgiN